MDRVVAPGATPERSFQKGAHEALGDSQLRRNMAHATGTIRDKRSRVVAELPDWAELRESGARIKDAALAGLPELLPQLEAAVSAAGGRVHWASDGEEACRIVAGVAREHGAREVVKVKSIATDEIGLNEALADAGVTAIETDLAELIVQLSDDRPSHILVPAIHKNRSEIRDIFRAELGLPDLSDEPAALAEAARLHLRAKFLEARVGVSGANFAVAETGTVCVFESEGNGRMCTTLPDVLVTVMGIEKLVPSWQDMEVFLQLLPRSSTGERMNPYTSFWTGVRPGDGPQEFHLVLLDNGRTRALADDIGRQTLRCIRCSACLNVCPVYSRTGGHAYGSVYPGPIGAILTPQLVDGGHADSLPFASTLCGACADVCPVQIDIPEVLVHLRDRAVDRRGPLDAESLSMRSLVRAFSSRRGYERLQRLGRVAQRPLVRQGRIRRAPPGPLAAWTSVRDLPPVAEQTFREWWRAERGGGRAARSGGGGELGQEKGWRQYAAPGDAARAGGGEPGHGLAGPAAAAARERVLASVRDALDGAPPAAPVPRSYRRRPQGSHEAAVAL
ncbi:MAG TPA: LutB/LldF family L-lactate oxidation iron-sulfur protein, partial [Thermoleophilaceae bacterium]|nr:LutB/LldF family L-lactate oxidation iron-sulfur protein [Thermoleophilaceae bacterium]